MRAGEWSWKEGRELYRWCDERVIPVFSARRGLFNFNLTGGA